MTSNEMASETVMQQRTELEKSNIDARRTDWELEQQKKMNKNIDGMFTCKCGSAKTTFKQMQTRGADEPMTNFITCLECGTHWKD